MKSLILSLLVAFASVAFAQNNLTATIDGKAWNPKTVSAGVEKVMDLTTFTIIGQNDKERLDIHVDYNVLKGKRTATLDFFENLMAPPGGASLSYAPNGLGKEQWVSATGKLVLTEFNEKDKTASGTFEGTITKMLDEKGGFVMTMPKPSKKISGKFEKVQYRVVE